ncbi:Conserved_hypothetical protein [Hexamita inflata]|uniref:Uncharacterized protein n=1 Tax=Hexamita inflata TaxID=28002 RepID=A0AA86TQ61_9EUKA|nr:Conserved hypothetical protein [Hexamita inflata]
MQLMYTLQLNCFDINSTVTYLRQSRQAIFEAWPSQILNRDQYHICSNIINGKQFTITIQIGTNTFTTTTFYTFDASTEIKIQMDCAVAGQCLYANINQFSIAIFSLYFPSDDITISSVAGSLRNRIFDHLQCKTHAQAAISLLSGSEQVMASTTPVSECKVSPAYEIIKIIAYLNSAEISEMAINLSTKFPVALHPQFIKYINDLPFICAARPDQLYCIGMSKALIQTEFINFVAGSRNKINVRYQGQIMQFDQNIKFLFTTIESAQTQDCFSSPVMTFYDKYLRVEADSGPCTKCSLAYFASIFSFDSIYLRFIMNVNEDYTGFKYLNEYQVTDYHLGTKFDKMLTCEMMTDVNACKTQLPLVLENMKDNSTIRLALVFKKNDAVVYKALYTPKISQPQIQTANVSIFDEKVCVKFQPVTDNEFLNVQVILHQLKLELQITTNTNTSVYCHQLDQAEKKQLNTILVDKKQLVATVNFDNVLVTDVPVLLIQQGDQPTFVWIIAAIIIVIAFIVIVFLQQCQK